MIRRLPLELESVVSWILRGGVLAAVAMVLCGVVAWIAAGGSGYAPGVYPTSLPQVADGLRLGAPLAAVQAGVLVLILTPVLQVAASVALFARDGDRLFAGLSTVVLVLLLIGIFYGAGGH